MTVPRHEFLAVIRETLTLFYKEAGELLREHDNVPIAGSQAAKEVAEDPSPDWIVLAQSISGQLVEFGGEHVTGLVKLITEPVEVIACWSLLRAMIEGCAFGVWLTDPAIDAHVRAGRVLALHYEGLTQQIRFGRAGQYEPDRIKMAEDRIDEIEQQALALGFAAVQDKNKRRIGIGQKMPTATDLVRDMLDEEAMYRMLSGVTHAQSWAIMGLGYTAAKDPKVNIGATKLTMKYEKDVNMVMMMSLGVKTASTFARLLRSRSEYYGWNTRKFVNLFELVFDKLKAPEKTRFWR